MVYCKPKDRHLITYKNYNVVISDKKIEEVEIENITSTYSVSKNLEFDITDFLLFILTDL